MRFFHKPSLGVALSLSGVLGAGVLVMRPEPVPEVEGLPAVFAVPAELAEVRALGRGQTLGGVLSDAVDSWEHHVLLMAFEEQATPRRMQIGTEITLRFRRADRWLRGVDVVLNADSTVRLTRDETGWRSKMVRTPTWTDTIYAAGEIEDVLWNAVVQSDALDGMPIRDRAQLIHHLDQVFQWEIDFSRQIRRGDQYRFAFERQVRPDGSMRSGHLIAAELTNRGTQYQALWFEPSGENQGGYFGPDGKSVQREFLLKPARVSPHILALHQLPFPSDPQDLAEPPGGGLCGSVWHRGYGHRGWRGDASRAIGCPRKRGGDPSSQRVHHTLRTHEAVQRQSASGYSGPSG